MKTDNNSMACLHVGHSIGKICPNRTNKLLFSSLVLRVISQPTFMAQCIPHAKMGSSQRKQRYNGIIILFRATSDPHFLGLATLHKLKCVWPNFIQPCPFTLWLPCVWLPQQSAKVPKGCKVGLDRNLKLAVEHCFYQQSRVFLWRDPSTGVSTICLPQWPQRLFLVASTALPRTITWQGLLEYAPHNGNKNHNPWETAMLGHHPSPQHTHKQHKP
jgi:hypothetical protein